MVFYCRCIACSCRQNRVSMVINFWRLTQTNLKIVLQELVNVAHTPPGLRTVRINMIAMVHIIIVKITCTSRYITALELLGVLLKNGVIWFFIELWRSIYLTVKLVVEQEPHQECIVTIGVAVRIVTVHRPKEASITNGLYVRDQFKRQSNWRNDKLNLLGHEYFCEVPEDSLCDAE